MNDLQDAIDWVDSGPIVVGAKHITALAEAARKYANRDYEAGANVLEVHLPEAIQPYALRMAQDTINAALGISEDTK